MENKDLFIIGGGIHGAAIAADAAGRGLSVTLCEKNDIASATSSASTKLIHGGLRYLELFDVTLVKEALAEREILMRKAPHLITPLQFILPHGPHSRPAWLIRLGLFLYDHLSKKNILPSSTSINLKQTHFGDALQQTYHKGFSYYDCFTDDSRLTLLNALAAKENGAIILTHHEFIKATPFNQQWKITFKNLHTNETEECFAKILINASGPWTGQTQTNISSQRVIPYRLVKGSHIIVPQLFAGDFAYILQNKDERVVFAIPYQNKFTLIGTTDTTFTENINAQMQITREEENYLCNVINHYFKKSISVADIVWSYAGVRCLQADDKTKPSRISRDHKVYLDSQTHPPLVTIIGGKLTTHRILAEEIVNLLKPFFPTMKPAWTAFSPLPGGHFPEGDFEKFYEELKKSFSWLPEAVCYRYAKNYGTRALIILENTKNLNDLGEDFTNGLYEKEVRYLIQHEWAHTVEDILWRRTKLGLVINNEAKSKIVEWLNHNNCLL